MWTCLCLRECAGQTRDITAVWHSPKAMWPHVWRSLPSCEMSLVGLITWRRVSGVELTPPSVQPVIFFCLSFFFNCSFASSYLRPLFSVSFVDWCPSKAADMMLRHVSTVAPDGQTRQCPLKRPWPLQSLTQSKTSLPETDGRTPAMTQPWILSRVCFFSSSSLWPCLSLASLRENVMPEPSKMEWENVYFTGFWSVLLAAYLQWRSRWFSTDKHDVYLQRNAILTKMQCVIWLHSFKSLSVI